MSKSSSDFMENFLVEHFQPAENSQSIPAESLVTALSYSEPLLHMQINPAGRRYPCNLGKLYESTECIPRAKLLLHKPPTTQFHRRRQFNLPKLRDQTKSIDADTAVAFCYSNQAPTAQNRLGLKCRGLFAGKMSNGIEAVKVRNSPVR